LRIASTYEAASKRRIPPPAFGPLPAEIMRKGLASRPGCADLCDFAPLVFASRVWKGLTFRFPPMWLVCGQSPVGIVVRDGRLSNKENGSCHALGFCAYAALTCAILVFASSSAPGAKPMRCGPGATGFCNGNL